MECLEIDQTEEFPGQILLWDARSTEVWSKQAVGWGRRDIDELNEFGGRVGEWGSDGEE
jgi:hypothetical protein